MLTVIVSLGIGLRLIRVQIPLSPLTSCATQSKSLTSLSLASLLQMQIGCCHGNDRARAEGWQGLSQNKPSTNGSAIASTRYTTEHRAWHTVSA